MVTPNDGDVHVRLPAISLGGTVSMHGRLRIQMSNAMWMRWAEIAVENEQAAHAARTGVVDRRNPGEALAVEQKASMIAITASAHALDAFCGRFIEAMDEKTRNNWLNDRGNRKNQMLTSFGRMAKLKPDAWRTEFDWLFTDMRNPASHYLESLSEPVHHPYYETQVNPDLALFSAESASRAANLMLDVMEQCLSSPRSEVLAKATGMLANVRRLRATRTPGSPDR